MAQTATTQLLEPTFEADLDPSACGHRSENSAGEVVRRVRGLLWQTYAGVVDRAMLALLQG